MWGRKKELAAPQFSPAATSTGIEQSAAARIGKSVKVKGEIAGGEDVHFDGELEGSVELPEHTFTVGPNGKVNARVIARNVVVHGTLHGNARASGRIEISRTGSLLGDLTTSRIVVEEGAYFKGTVETIRHGQGEEVAPFSKAAG